MQRVSIETEDLEQMEEKELEDQLVEIGTKLLESLSSANDELLQLLNVSFLPYPRFPFREIFCCGMIRFGVGVRLLP
ncbi:hypothetical protein ACLOJK_000050 [Asimina triloba]